MQSLLTRSRRRTWNNEIKNEANTGPDLVELGDVGDELPHLSVSFVDGNDFIPNEVHLHLAICARDLRKLLEGKTSRVD